MDLAGLMRLPPQGLIVFLLVLVRASAIFLTAPVLGNSSVPMRLKIGLAFMLALIITPLVMHQTLAFDYQSPLSLAVVVLQEIAIGLLLGLLAQLLFVAVQFAGQVVGLQMGIGIASVFDPQSHQQVSVVAQFYLLIAVLIFLLVDGHHWLVIALDRSFTAIPLGTFALDERVMAMLISATNDMFWVALMLMAPVLGVLVLSELAMGIVARIMPQMNVFMAAFPVKIGLGIVTMALSFPMLVAFLGPTLEDTFMKILRFVGTGP